ncbi:MAG TPA: hypothetical protein VKV57_11940 [bacterium]|nr:hypothetical protein [bacterium]
MRLVALEKEEVLRLLEAAKRHGPRSHAMVLHAIRHGLRAAKVMGLWVEHVKGARHRRASGRCRGDSAERR